MLVGSLYERICQYSPSSSRTTREVVLGDADPALPRCSERTSTTQEGVESRAVYGLRQKLAWTTSRRVVEK